MNFHGNPRLVSWGGVLRAVPHFELERRHRSTAALIARVRGVVENRLAHGVLPGGTLYPARLRARRAIRPAVAQHRAPARGAHARVWHDGPATIRRRVRFRIVAVPRRAQIRIWQIRDDPRQRRRVGIEPAQAVPLRPHVFPRHERTDGRPDRTRRHVHLRRTRVVHARPVLPRAGDALSATDGVPASQTRRRSPRRRRHQTRPWGSSTSTGVPCHSAADNRRVPRAPPSPTC